MTTDAEGRAPGRTPLTILTGFLGAGKTTLLNRILTTDHGRRVGVLVNDFGPINIDAELVVGVDDGMISLANGCVCCQIRDDLVEAVDRLLARPDPPEHVVLEASGVADPLGIWTTFNDSKHRDRIALDGVVCVVDADQVFAHLDAAPELAMLKLRQVGCADLVVLNKVDLAGPDATSLARRWIDHNLRRVRIVETSFCALPNEILFGVGDTRADSPNGSQAAAADHGATFATWSWETGRPVSEGALGRMVRARLPGSVYRCKGIVSSIEHPEVRMALQCVGRRAELTPLDAWGDRPRRTRIVAIGDPSRMEADLLSELFEGCLAGGPGAVDDAAGEPAATAR